MKTALKNTLQLSKNTYAVIQGLRPNQHHNKSKKIILIQAVENEYYLGLLGTIALEIQRQYGVLIEYYLLRSIQPSESSSLYQWIKTRVYQNILCNYKWRKVYGSFSDGEGFAAIGLNVLKDPVRFFRAFFIWRKIKSKKQLNQLNIDGIHVGDLINDSYLRFKPAVTVKINDFYLCVLIWESIRLIKKSRHYFEKKEVVGYLSSYSTYIQHGIPVRVALQCNIPVFTFASLQTLHKKLSSSDTYHAANTTQYAKEFELLENKADKLRTAELALNNRLLGKIDSATSYMKVSAYTECVVEVPNVKGKIIIFLHDFYDSPHVYANMVFSDFWEWICFTIEHLQHYEIPFVIKPHPNQIALSNIEINILKEKYPTMELISSKITNRQLVEAGMVCGITVFGTVAHELAFMGVPTISSALHPHNSFNFCLNANDESEYALLLKKSNQITIDKEQMRYESLAFYYMHNMNKTDEYNQLLHLIGIALSNIVNNEFDMAGAIEKLKDLPIFQDIIKELGEEICGVCGDD